MFEVHLPGTNRHIQAILNRSQRANPSIVVGTRRIISIVKVEQDAFISWCTRYRQEITPLNRIEEIASTPVALAWAASIAKRQEETAPINVQPVEREGHSLALNTEMQPPHCRHRHRFLSIHGHVQQCWLNIRIKLSFDTRGRIVREIIQTLKMPPLLFI